MRVLIVRLSSMGDMVHTLPAVTDASRAIPDLHVDWVVDQAFDEIPAWHRAVCGVFASPPRRLSNLRSPKFKKFFQQLRSANYDFVIDLQGHWKSAFTARFAKGIHCGYEKKSVNEWGAHLLYKRKFSVSKKQHSILRMRELLARSLNYSFEPESVDYGIERSRLPRNPVVLPSPYLVFIHSTSWDSKCWAENCWNDLTQNAIDAGLSVVLPWGTQKERARARRIAGNHQEAIVLPPLSISQKASVIAGASGTVGLDTGLSHIAAALDVPSVTLYGATDPFLIGATGKNQVHIASDFECIHCHRSVCDYAKTEVAKPACFSAITADVVWSSLQNLLVARKSTLAPRAD